MPYTVTLRINVPTIGEKVVTFPNVVANSIPEAIEVAKQGILVEAVKAEKNTP
jgi:hypothetical protein